METQTKQPITTTLSIPTKITATQPKPTRAQIIEALLDRARTAHEAKEEEKEKQREALIEQATAIELAAARKIVLTADMIDLNTGWRSDYESTVRLTIPSSAKVQALKAKILKLSSNHFDRDATKKLIVAGMKAPNPLLGNPDTAKALDALLRSIMNPTAKIEDNTVDV